MPDDARGHDLMSLKSAPTVLMFRPTHYTVVPPEQLKEWERTMEKNVGVMATSDLRSSGSETWSISYGDLGWDDSDII